MFTGIIQKIGTVKRVSRGEGLVVEIGFEPFTRPLEEGESVAVNGVCLTVAKCDAMRFTADVLDETVSRTGIGDLIPGEKVNLERALRAGDSMGGHIVQGHVDCVGEVLECRRMPDGDFKLAISFDPQFAPLAVVKGGIAIDGVSLTVVEAAADMLSVRLIPVTLQDTALYSRQPGAKVNLEFDVVGRYILRMMELEKTPAKSGGVTMETLLEAGFL
jgi:riboflavin synthase